MPEDKRNQLIMQAILDKLGSNTGIYTAEDVLMAANIKDKDLQEVLKQHCRNDKRGGRKMSIGANIRKMRLEKEMTQEELAREVHVSRPLIAQLERETKPLTVPLAKELAAFFECSMIELIGEEVEQKQEV